jgi:hypothetical protein
MNKNAYTNAELRAMRAEQTTDTRAELRDWIRTAAEITSLAILAAALALLLWAL